MRREDAEFLAGLSRDIRRFQTDGEGPAVWMVGEVSRIPTCREDGDVLRVVIDGRRGFEGNDRDPGHMSAIRIAFREKADELAREWTMDEEDVRRTIRGFRTAGDAARALLYRGDPTVLEPRVRVESLMLVETLSPECGVFPTDVDCLRFIDRRKGSLSDPVPVRIPLPEDKGLGRLLGILTGTDWGREADGDAGD